MWFVLFFDHIDQTIYGLIAKIIYNDGLIIVSCTPNSVYYHIRQKKKSKAANTYLEQEITEIINWNSCILIRYFQYSNQGCAQIWAEVAQ